jgi:hypothetical protein
MAEAPQMEFFERFAWAVPRAFRAALALCRFEAGDLLYDTRKAYAGAWAEGLQHLRYSIQVLSPLAGATLRKPGHQDSVFASNWRTTAVVRLTEYRAGTNSIIHTTQGRIYATLWRGDPGSLPGESPEPPSPLRVHHVHKNLPAVAEQVFARCAGEATQSCLFLLAFDTTTDLLEIKRHKVAAALRKDYGAKEHILVPESLGLAEMHQVAPTVYVAGYAMVAPATMVRARLKELLYRPNKKRKGAAEKFRLEAHGFLATRTAAPDSPTHGNAFFAY